MEDSNHLIGEGIDRRTFLGLVAAITAALNLPGHVLADLLEDRETAAILRMARLLLPHLTLGGDAYLDSLAPYLDESSSTEAATEMLRIGIATLDRLSGGDWLAAGEADQIAVLKQMQNDPFFTTVLNDLRPSFYHHPAVWELIGYPGPSVAFGGYLHRGFDDIDWLPDDDEPDL